MIGKKRVLVTAGPTREMIDPVRFISNIATGELGYAIAREAKKRGHCVTLLSGPTLLPAPRGVKRVPFLSTDDLDSELKRYFPRCDVLIMSAAVCDFKAGTIRNSKVKRKTAHSLRLIRTKDLLKTVGKRKGKRLLIGFSLETENLVRNSVKKLREKKLDYVIANAYDRLNNPFGPRKTRVAIIDKEGAVTKLPVLSKDKIAKRIVKLCA